MYIYYSDENMNRSVISVADNCTWRIYQGSVKDNLCVYLEIFGVGTTVISNSKRYTDKITILKNEDIRLFYNELIARIYRKYEENIRLDWVDFRKNERDLYKNKYEKLWIRKGYMISETSRIW